MDVRSEVAAGRDVRVRPLAREINLPTATLYSKFSREELVGRRIGRCIIVPNAVARQLLGMDEVKAA